MPSVIAALRLEVEGAVEAEVLRVGPEAFQAATIAHAFADRGVSRATLYRLIAAHMKSGVPAMKAVRQLEEAVAERARRAEDPAADAAQEAAGLLPAIPRIETIAQAGGIGSVLDQLRRCSAAADAVMAHSMAADGRIRNVKLYLAGSEHLRRVVETAARLRAQLADMVEVERFHEQLIAAIAEEAPELAERVVQRLRRFCDQRVGM